MSSYDGRKRVVVYKCNFSSIILFDWYFEIKETLARDGFKLTHLALSVNRKQSKRITQIKMKEKRYINLFNEDPSDANALELYSIEDDVEYLSSCYLINMVLIKSRYSKKSHAMLVFDYSVLDSINIETYMDITKKYIEWNKEIIFDCGKREAPINYIINERPWGLKEFKLISERNGKKQ